MTEINQKLNELNKNLFIVLDNINNISDEKFDLTLNKIKSIIPKIDVYKLELENILKSESHSKECEVYHNTIKLINQKFDSIIEEKKVSQEKISEELYRLINKKKLINYQR